MFLFAYPSMQYPHHLGDNLHANINFHIRFFVFVILVSSVVTPPLVTLEAIHWARDGSIFVCRIDGCDASYWPNTTWYGIFGHATIWLWSWTSPKHPSTREEGPRHQDHVAMYARVLNNLLAWYCCNE
jgi:hypothetical protein